jgi:hypothetical protein
MVHTACALQPLPRHINWYFQSETAINCIALMYTLKKCADQGDFSFVSWPVILWGVVSNFLGIFIECTLVPRTNLYIKVYARVMLSFIWILLGTFKLYYSFNHRTTKVPGAGALQGSDGSSVS